MFVFKKTKDFLLKNQSTRQTIAKNTLWLSVSQIGSRLIRAVIIIYAARVLGAAEYGIFSYVLGFAGFFTIFADIGVNPLLTRNIARNTNERAVYFANSFWIKTILLAITAILVIFIAPHFTSIEVAKALVPLVAVIVIADGIREFALSYIRGIERMEVEAFIISIMNVTILVAGLVILSFDQTAKALLYAYMASVAFASIISVVFLRKQFANVFKNVTKERLHYVITSAWPIAFAGMLGVFMLNTDVVMLGWWRTAEEIGYYAAGQRIVQVLYTLPALLASALFPIISRLVHQKNNQEKLINEKSIALAYAMALPISVGGIILASDIITLLFGTAYLPAIPAFQILLLTPLILFPGVLIANLTIAHDKQRKTMKFIAIGALGNIAFNALLIPIWGIQGAAIATLIAQLLNNGLMWRYMKKITNFKTLPHLKKIIGTTAVMGLATITLKYLGLSVLIVIPASALLYVILLYFLKEPILREIKTVFTPSI